QRWYPVLVDLGAAREYWGGAASGHIEQGIRSIRILATTRTGQPEAGAVQVDRIELLEAMPVAEAPTFAGGVLTIDNFEDRPVAAPWTLWHTTGAGTAATLATDAGAGSARSLRIDYAFSCLVANSSCGQYALGILNLPTELPAARALRFLTRSPASARIKLRVVDSSGQTLQYSARRAPAGYDVANWYPVVVDLDQPDEFWGGAGSGVVSGALRSVRVLVSTETGRAESASAWFDDIELLSAMPTVAAPSFADGALMLDDFEGRPAVAPWTSWHTSGSGTAASVTLGAGDASTHAMRLDYAFDCTLVGSNCGQFALAILAVPADLPAAAALQLRTRSTLGAELKIRIVDGSGQTLQYATTRAPAGYDPAQWYSAVVDLGAPDEHWGGAASGTITGGIQSVHLLVMTRTGRAEAGSLSIDNLTLLEHLPPPELPTFVGGRWRVDDFEDRAVLAPWTFWATGGNGTAAAMVPAGGYQSARGMRIDYAFACLRTGSDCGEYGMAIRSLPAVVEGAASLSFMTRLPLEARVQVWIVDDSGQTLRYAVTRPLAAYQPSAWFRASVPLARPSGWWGGAANGVITGGIRKIQLVVSSTAGRAVSGSAEIDDLVLLQGFEPPLVGFDDSGVATIDAVDGRGVAGPWSVFGGNAQSNVSIGLVADEQGGSALAMDYRFDCAGGVCGNYVVAQMAMPEAVVSGQALSLALRSEGNVTLALRVIDASGETLQYPLQRSLEGAREALWYRATAHLDAAETTWGGDGNGRLDGPIQGVALVARNALGEAASGRVAFDDIRVHERADADYVLDHESATIAPDVEDLELGQRFGAAFHPGTTSRPFDVVESAGLGTLRMDLFWSRVEMNGQYDFSAYDSIVQEILARGLQLVLILDYGHPDHDVRGTAGMAAFARYAGQAAQRYAGERVRFEIWNEPDHPNFWGGAPSAAEYSALARATLAEIRAVAPDAMVSSGGLSYFDFPYLRAMLRLGAADAADAIAVHAYEQPEGLAEKWVMADRLIRDETGDRKPLWITEWGYSVDAAEAAGQGDEAGFLEWQAKMAVRSVLSHWALGADLSIAYKLARSGSDPLSVEDNYGLFEQNLDERPAATAIRSVLALAEGKLNLGLLADTPPGLHVMVLADEHETVYAIWQSDPDHASRVTLPIAGLVSLGDFLGVEWSPLVTAGSGGSLPLDLTEARGPVFVRYAH
ncbi:MAG: cellulase family glycosylhydrolase, partial [Rhodocyclaceae bacterium]|nr:cellulase family glycosylhydrolase [Rhodocyclaceae bacterium]